MKIIRRSNHDLETYAQVLIMENVPEQYAAAACAGINAKFSGHSHPDYYQVVSDDYVLWRGMEDLV